MGWVKFAVLSLAFANTEQQQVNTEQQQKIDEIEVEDNGFALGVRLLLLSSFGVFYKFAWLYFRERLFPHHSFAAASCGKYGRGSEAEGTLSLNAAGRAFSSTFALSFCILELIILEVAGLLDPASSALAWRLCLSLMVIALHLVLPFLLAYSCLGELGLGRRTSFLGACVVMSLVLTFASRMRGHRPLSYDGFYGRDGGGGVMSPDGHNRPPSSLSLEAALARVGVVGVASLAILSGFGAVNLPYQHVATLFRTVPSSLVTSRERRARLTLADIGQRKRQAAIARAAHVGGWGGSGVGGGGFSDGSKRNGRSMVSRIVNVFSSRSRKEEAVNAAEAAKTAGLEQISRDLFLEVADCRRIQEQQRRARTLPGRVLVVFGAVMFLYCLLRLWKAGVTVLYSAEYYSTGSFSAGRGDGGEARGSGGAGGGDDPATRLVRFALSRHLLDDVDAADGWSEFISFVLIGVLVLLQTRGFLMMMMTMSKASVISGTALPAQVLSLLLSMLMGTYFTSSVILLRVNLPPRHRTAITAVLGGMRFSFYQRWFDTFFLLSGCATGVTLLVFHLANRNSDADNADASQVFNSRSKSHLAMD